MAMTISELLGLTQGPSPNPVSIADIVSGIQSQYSGSPESTYQFQTGLNQYLGDGNGSFNNNQFSGVDSPAYTPGKFDLNKFTGIQNNAAINAAISSGSGYRPQLTDSFYEPQQPGESYQDFFNRVNAQRQTWEAENPMAAKVAGMIPGVSLYQLITQLTSPAYQENSALNAKQAEYSNQLANLSALGRASQYTDSNAGESMAGGTGWSNGSESTGS